MNDKIKNVIITIVVILIFISALAYRVKYYRPYSGGDFDTYYKAVTSFLAGQNPYVDTVISFEAGEISGSEDMGHGYAYLPGMLYTMAGLYKLNHLFQLNVPLKDLWAIPFLFLEFIIGILIFRDISKINKLYAVLALILWFFNPYAILKHSFAYKDFPPILFCLLALKYVKTSSVKSGVFYALAVIFKTYPIILLPLMFMLVKNKTKFVITGIFMAILVSLPFLTSVENATTYVKGSLLVHGERKIQGRPILYYYRYYYDIDLIERVPFRLYVYISLVASWPVVVYLYLNGYKQEFGLSILPFINFFFFTPVFNKTYYIWGLPIFLIGLAQLYDKKWRVLFYISAISSYFAYFFYLIPWDVGFHIWFPIK